MGYRVAHEDPFLEPGAIMGRGAGIAVILEVISRRLLIQDQTDDVLGVSLVESILGLGGDDIVGRSYHVAEVSNLS